MSKIHRLIAILVTVMVILGAWCACAQDWPQWRGANRDGHVTGFAAPEQWPAALTQAWSVMVGEGDATPALVGDRLYVFTRQGDEEVTRCLSAADGSELWREAYVAAPVTGPSARHPGTRSSPAVAEGKVVTLGAAGVLSCLDAETGALVWRKDPFPNAVPSFFTACSPIIVNGMAIAHLGAEDNGAIIAYDLATGEDTWRWDGMGPQYSSPVLMTAHETPQLVTLTANSVVGLDVATGALLWQLPFVPQGRAYNSATPVVNGEMVIVTGSGRGTRALRVVAQEGGFGVEEVWSNPDISCQFSTPVLHEGLLFGLSDRGTLFCLRAETGETAWVGADQLDRGSFGPVVDVGSALLVLPSSGDLIVFAPSAEAYTELARIKASDTPVYAHPVIAGNRVFVKGQDTLTLWVMQ
ncbi:MAG: PQQ-binding-like beta-propeller repeat protein [Armatimonadota bacterium]